MAKNPREPISAREANVIAGGFFAVLVLMGVLAWALAPGEAVQQTAETETPMRLIPTR